MKLKYVFIQLLALALMGCGSGTGGGDTNPPSSSSSSNSSSSTPSAGGGGGLSDRERSLEAFENSVYPLVRTHCAACHGNNALSFLPQFASADLSTAHDAASNVIDLSNIAASRVLSQLNASHNCWSNCTSDAGTMEQAILNWYSAINDLVSGGNPPGPLPPIDTPTPPPTQGTTRTDYDNQGDFRTTSHSLGSSCTVYRPQDLDGSNAVILWGNGTGASPRSYRGLLTHWASWGFVVVAANTTNAGTGRDMIGCLDTLSSSSIAGQVNLQRVGTSGHSQGGGGAIMAGTDQRITTTAPIEGYTLGLGHDRDSHDEQSGPMLLLSGGDDGLVSPSLNHGSLIQRANVPVFWGILRGASHFEPVGDGGGFRDITTAWFLFQLNGNTTARPFFEGSNCGYCRTSEWEVEKKDMP